MKTVVALPTISVIALAGLLALAVPISSVASSNAAWAQFRTHVDKTCREAAVNALNIQTVEVDPWGSTHYGLARLVGTAPEIGEQGQLLCVYDKHTHRAEVGTVLPIEASGNS